MQSAPRHVRCPACGARDLDRFYEVRGVPAHSCMLMPTRREAIGCATGDVELAFCPSCGLISNVRFDPTLLDYSRDYEETQGFSPRFRAFAEALAQRLIDRHDLRDKDVLEIGCGKGEFLALLCGLGANRGVGIDPSFRPERVDPDSPPMTILRELLGPAHLELETDFLCCRHTLEHISDVAGFVDMLATVLRNRAGGAAFVEVPDVRRVLREVAFWDVYHEHCSYFSLGSLARLFRSRGLAPTSLWTDFDDQYLLMEAIDAVEGQAAVLPEEEAIDVLAAEVAYFRRSAASAIEDWRHRLEELHRRGRRVALWGSGSKGVAFLTSLGIRDEVAYVVDINPFKHGMYMAGTGQQIVAPHHVRLQPPDVVIVMNPIYREEIRAEIDDLGVAADVVPLEARVGIGDLA